MGEAKSCLVLSVRRQEPELVAPAKPTPREQKRLSDIDDQESLRFHIRVVHFYKSTDCRERDPAKVIKGALANALVFYYPFAGRLREGPGRRKLVVDCTGDGVLFIEADADVTLDQFGHALQPPFPYLDELLFDVPGSSGVLHCPLLLIQVTRLRCGGFIFAVRINHTMSDGFGMVHFMNAVAELARGKTEPSVLPVWNRELLSARDPPRVTCKHIEYDEVEDTKGSIISPDDMVHCSFFFGPAEVSTLRKSLPHHLQGQCTTFELLTASIWRCRTIALQPDPEEVMRLICIVNVRSKFKPPLPGGYYGNAFALPMVLSTADVLCSKPLSFALELVKKAKAVVTEEYMRSLADFMVTKGRPHFNPVNTYLVSDVTRVGFLEVDFGWGKPVYAGPADGGVGASPAVTSFHISFQSNEGEKGILIPLCLPSAAMDRFVKELHLLLKDAPEIHHPAVHDTSASY